jgi:hypothetical protein
MMNKMYYFKPKRVCGLLLTTLWAALQPALKSLSHEIVASAAES